MEFERFTREAHKVVETARDEARMMRHGHVGTEHLLVALADVPPLGMNRSSARAEVVKAVGLGDEPDTGQMMPFTAAAQEALETSVHESMKLGHDTVEPGHVLLGLLRQRDGVALRVLAASGRSLRDLREAVIDGLTRDTADGPVTVRVGTELVGDLGNFRTDARLLLAMLERGGPMAAWLRERGVDEAAVRRLL
jgi:ATP-dependent Clp protease ATP-binding subunit ClpA